MLTPNGSGERLVLRAAGDPVWSPDGARIAFTRAAVKAQRVDVYVAGRDGRGVRLVLRNAMSPAWSPDGTRIAVARDRCFPRACGTSANPFELYTIAPDGTGLRRLTSNSSLDDQPAWSPDGTQLVFATGDGLFVIAADGSGRRRLARGVYQENPAWSPDGRTILYDTFTDIFALDLATGRSRRLTRNPGPDLGPAWSPDGTRIAYLSEAVCGHCFTAEDPLQIWVMNADGSRAKRVTRGRGYTSVDWH